MNVDLRSGVQLTAKQIIAPYGQDDNIQEVRLKYN